MLSGGSCQACSQGCTACSSQAQSSCTSCITGFYLANSSCLRCPGYCANCQSPSLCLQLKDGDGQALQCTDSGECFLVDCDQGCKQCSENNPGMCLECELGFYLSSGLCRQCTASSNCMSCNASEPAQCTSCFPNTFLTVNQGVNICASCQFPCLTCALTNLTSCLSCPRGYLLTNGACQSGQCPTFCQSCDSSSNCL